MLHTASPSIDAPYKKGYEVVSPYNISLFHRLHGDIHMIKITPRDFSTLEEMLDTYGLSALLSGIEQVCLGKAYHIQENWGEDTALADSWIRAARAVECAAALADVNEVSP